jgi:lipopolysaccharide assembly protein B
MTSLNLFYLFLILLLIGLVVLYFFRFRSIKSPQSDQLFTEALNALISGKDLLAINLLRQIVKNNSEHILAYLQLGNILRKSNPSQAIKIHQSLTIRPNLSKILKVDVHQALARDYKAIDNLSFARMEAEKIINLDKKNLWALKFLLKIDEKEKKWDRSIKWTKHIQKLTGENIKNNIAKFEVLKGKDKYLNGDLKEAEDIYLKTKKKYPNLELSYLYLGDLYEKVRDLVKAVENWKEFASKDPLNALKVFSKIESGLFDLGRFSEVENFYRKFIKQNPSNFEAIIRLANVLNEKGENSSALSLLESFDNIKKNDIRVNLIKLKLSLINSTPVELSQQIDLILEKITDAKKY